MLQSSLGGIVPCAFVRLYDMSARYHFRPKKVTVSTIARKIGDRSLMALACVYIAHGTLIQGVKVELAPPDESHTHILLHYTVRAVSIH